MYRGKASKLESRVFDLELLQTQSAAVIKRLQSESMEKSRKIVKLESSSSSSQQQARVTSRSEQVFNPRLEMTSLVEKNRSGGGSKSKSGNNRGEDLDLIAMYDRRSKQMEAELANMQKR